MGLFASAKTTEQLLLEAAEAAVKRSLITRPMIVMTTDEVKRRAMIAGRLAGQLAHDLGWSAFKVRDMLPSALEAALDGKSWEPDTRSTWLIDDKKPGNGDTR